MPDAAGWMDKLLTEYGLAGVVIAALVSLLFWTVRQQRIERGEMRKAHAEERAQLQKVNDDHRDGLKGMVDRSDATNQETNKVLRELTAVMAVRNELQRGGGA